MPAGHHVFEHFGTPNPTALCIIMPCFHMFHQSLKIFQVVSASAESSGRSCPACLSTWLLSSMGEKWQKISPHRYWYYWFYLQSKRCQAAVNRFFAGDPTIAPLRKRSPTNLPNSWQSLSWTILQLQDRISTLAQVTMLRVQVVIQWLARTIQI